MESPLQSESKNSETLKDFAAYCKAHPEERFWEALRNWTGFRSIHVYDESRPSRRAWRNTLYIEGKR